ncbi:MAG TPA: CoA pyrophosphatase [Steroidobacteraceae bacterium]|nr:CoA pyrophosphatase [Steroidobacteraceae bacterium]
MPDANGSRPMPMQPPEGGRGKSRYDRVIVRQALRPRPSGADEDMEWLPGSTMELRARIRSALPQLRTAAAVLVPLIERDGAFSVLLTQRAATLRDHAGQIAFPGGRIEPQDADPWSAALREAQEEIGLDPAGVEFAGYLPDHLIVTGYRVTPVVGFVDGGYTLRVDASEVEDAFEVPLDFLFDEANHKTRVRMLGDVNLTVYDIAYGGRRIWGATAGMLMTLRRMLERRAAGSG